MPPARQLSMTDEKWRDRIRGLLLGGALGDALGAPFEGVPEVDPVAVERRLAGNEPLRWTDDTALQLVLADHIADHLATSPADGELVDDDLVLAFAREWRAHPDRGYGPNPPRIFSAALAGGDWRAEVRGAFGGSGSLGNGGAMRAAPVGALPGDAERVIETARRSAAVTHAHPVGQEAAAVVALAVHWDLRDAAATRAGDVLEYCATAVSSQALHARLQAVPAAVERDDPREAAARTGNSVAADESVAAALAAALSHPEDPVAAIAFAVRMGGDADSIAAMAGSIVGAWTGASVLPHELVSRLGERERIEAVATRLTASTAQGGPGRPPQ